MSLIRGDIATSRRRIALALMAAILIGAACTGVAGTVIIGLIEMRFMPVTDIADAVAVALFVSAFSLIYWAPGGLVLGLPLFLLLRRLRLCGPLGPPVSITLLVAASCLVILLVDGGPRRDDDLLLLAPLFGAPAAGAALRQIARRRDLSETPAALRAMEETFR